MCFNEFSRSLYNQRFLPNTYDNGLLRKAVSYLKHESFSTKHSSLNSKSMHGTLFNYPVIKAP